MSVYVDLSEFLAEPRKGGIQRTAGELCRHWPSSTELIPVKVRCNGRLARLPQQTLDFISNYFKSDVADAGPLLNEIRAVERDAESIYPMIDFEESDVLLCPETLNTPLRLDFYGRLPANVKSRCCFIVYDLLPLTNPEYFDKGATDEMAYRYYCVLRDMGHLAFISKATQKAYHQRFLRTSRISGAVLHPGCDSLGKRDLLGEGKTGRSFVVVGDLVPHKHHGLVLEAFERLLQKVNDVALIFIGRMSPTPDPQIRESIDRFQREYPQFQWIEEASDETLRSYVQNARATLFISGAEGFGLPPVESLWLGTPVIGRSDIPSLEHYGGQGLHILDPLTATTLREAVVAFLNEPYYRQKVAEVRQLQLPRWKSFAVEVEGWVRHIHEAVPA